MRTGGQFFINWQTIKLKGINDTVKLIPFGDIHRDSPAFADDEWARFLAHAKKQKNAIFLGMGDYLDGYSTSEREIMYSHKLHESSAKRHADEGRARVRALAKELDFMKGRILGVTNGNHYQCYNDGTNSDQYLANLLGTKYLGVCSVNRLMFDINRKNASITIVAHHGRGAGTTAGGRFNSVEKLASYFPEAEIALMGDNHARGALPLGDKLTLVKTCNAQEPFKLKSRKTFIGRTGSFLKSYEPGEASYVVDACLSPASLGWIEFGISFTRTGDSIDVDIRAVS